MRPSFFHHLHPPTISADQARLLVLAVGLHVGSVILTGANAAQRRLKSLIGFGLLCICLALNFSGCTLRTK
jgi:hypothetical protein